MVTALCCISETRASWQCSSIPLYVFSVGLMPTNINNYTQNVSPVGLNYELVCFRVSLCSLTCNLGWMVIRVQQRAEAPGHLYLSWVGPQWMDVCVARGQKIREAKQDEEIKGKTCIWFGHFILTTVKSLGCSLQHLQGERCNDVCLSGDCLGSLHCLCPQRGDHLSPIDQSKALWGKDRPCDRCILQFSKLFGHMMIYSDKIAGTGVGKKVEVVSKH